LNIENPVGQGTNIALQKGPELLHPSIDDSLLNKKFQITKPFEAIALLFSFLFNQASNFWGWGGLWLWPQVLYLAKRLHVNKFKTILRLLLPVLTTHLALVVTSPIPAPRYVMPSILMGIIMLLIMLISGTEKSKLKGVQQ